MMPLERAVAQASAYYMVESLSFQNFKCFKKLQLSRLQRFNVIVGRNAGGKTAFLEGLFLLAATSAQLVMAMRVFRGFAALQVSHDRQSFEAVFRDLFHDFDDKGSIELRVDGSDGNTRGLVISYADPQNVVLPFGVQDPSAGLAPAASINFTWTKANGDSVVSKPAMTPQGLDFGQQVDSFPAFLWTPTWREPPMEPAKRFSELSKRGNEKRLVDAIRAEFPFVEGLSVEYHSGLAVLHAKLRSSTQKIPLPLVSDGVNKTVSMLIGLETYQHGVILVDEIENGLYFNTTGHISETLLDFAKRSEAQLFVTTHSMEYLKSIAPLVAANPEDFCLLRTTKDNGSCDIDQFDGHHFAAALEAGFEIR